VADLRGWWAGGETLTVELGGTGREVFLARAGSGAAMTLLHGFPSSSHDWAKVLPELAASHTVLAPDFLGFGASEKPKDHRYSLLEQADLIEAVWAHAGVSETTLVAHDYGVSVAQELLARHDEGKLAVRLAGARFMNGGIYPELHRPQPLQIALLDPEQGPRISELVTEELFIAGLRPTFAEQYDAEADSADIWAAMAHRRGARIGHLLIRYMTDREEHGERWTRALESTGVPLGFIWGMLDPVSGAHMAGRIRERIPAAPFVALDDIGHWPPLEAPGRVLAALLG
jgi:pimeloyl-ACP methyl ester carboxylesterase